jgi:hypothetical protein
LKDWQWFRAPADDIKYMLYSLGAYGIAPIEKAWDLLYRLFPKREQEFTDFILKDLCANLRD